MNWRHLFEFMDQNWLPKSLHATLREILECGNAKPFRPYYAWAAEEVLREAREHGCTTVVELGAGSAPISRILAQRPDLDRITCVVSDDHPDTATYIELQKIFPNRLKVCLEPVDFSQPQDWPPNTLLYLSGAFHHIPPAQRVTVLATLSRSATRIMVVEPLRKTPLCMFFVFFSIFPALLLPLMFFNRTGRVRRGIWCWLCPIAPLVFWWDGFVSCWRMWTQREWLSTLDRMRPQPDNVQLLQFVFCQLVAWNGRIPQVAQEKSTLPNEGCCVGTSGRMVEVTS